VNDATEIVAICASVGSATTRSAGTKIKRIVAMESPCVRETKTHSLDVEPSWYIPQSTQFRSG